MSVGISPAFPISSENLRVYRLSTLTHIRIDGVSPPTAGPTGGFSHAHQEMNAWSPWIDEKLVEPKYDGVAKFLGTPSNKPTHIKDYHMISMMRAVDHLLAPKYVGVISASSDTIGPISPPID